MGAIVIIVVAITAVVAAAVIAAAVVVIAAAVDCTATRVKVNVIKIRPSKRFYNLASILLSRSFIFTPHSFISRARL